MIINYIRFIKIAIILNLATTIGAQTLPKVTLSQQVTGTLPVANGGTGATTLTSGAFLKGNGTSAVSGSSNLTETADTVFVSKFLNVDTSTLYVNAVNNRVGIGTTTPINKFSIVESSGDAGVMSLTTYRNTNGQSSWVTNFARGTESSPSIIENGDIIGEIVFNGYTGSSFVLGQVASITVQVNGTVTSSPFSAPSDINFNTAADGTAYNSPRLTIKSSGNVGIGTIAPGSRLHTKSSTSNDALLVEDDSGACEAQPTTTGLTWSCSSDQRLKTDIQIPLPILDYVVNIPLKDYTVIKTAERVMGPIAQELLETYPELVTTGEDGYYRVSSLGSWTLVKAIQEQQQIIETQKQEIDTLKTQYNDLLQRIINLENK